MKDKNVKNNKSGLEILRPYSSLGGGVFTLLLKGILSGLSALMVFNLIFYGLNIECDYSLMAKIIFGISFVFTLLQTNSIVLAAGLVFTVFKLYKYISANTEIIKNGVKTMANQCYPLISKALNLPSANGFDDIMADTYMTVNGVTAILGAVIAIIMVIVIVKLNSKILYAVGISLVFSFLSFFNCEINVKYALILLLCFFIAIILNLCGAYNFKISILSLFIKNKRNKGTFNADVAYTVQSVVICCIAFIIVGFGFKSVYSVDEFNKTFNIEYSENIKVTARDIAVMKYAEYKNFNIENNVSLGQLGYVSYTKPNLKRSVFRFVTKPIREGKIYFTSFVGEKYNYRYNDWTESSDDNAVMVNALKNAGADEKLYEIYTGDHKSYMPAYSEYKNYEYNEKNKAEITAYEYGAVNITDENYNNYVNNTYLTIDEENKKVLDKICSEKGFSKDDENIDDKLAEYLRNNFTYSTEVDILPYGKDFVNYFLEESKTGNFTQYASALTLLYRNIGIPARYVSGYAVEAGQTLAGSNAGGQRTNTVVKSANLYSWVEVYNSDGGWRIVDSIPAPTIEELDEKYGDESENTYYPDTSLDNYFRTVDKEKYSPSNMAKAGFSIILKFVLLIILAVLLVIALIFTVVWGYGYFIYIRSDNSKKAYIIMERIRKKYKINGVSYREMAKPLSEKYGEEKAEQIIAFSEKCIFSDNVSDDDIKKLRNMLK